MNSRNILDWYRGQPQLIRGVLVTVATYLFLALFFLVVRSMVSGRSSEVMLPYNTSNALVSENITGSQLPTLGNTSYNKILKVQDQVISLRRQHHYELAMLFLKNYSAVITSLIFISCLGGLLLFVLINNGWAQSSYTVKAFFLSIASAGICLGLFTSVFSQQKNFEDNMLRYMNYTKAEMHLARHVSELSKKDYPHKPIPKTAIDNNFKPSNPPQKGDSVEVIDTILYLGRLDTLIARNAETLNTYTDYIMSIDASKIKSITEVYQLFMNMKESGIDSTQKR